MIQILVTATSTDGLTATTGVNVVVNDTNDSAPKFLQVINGVGVVWGDGDGECSTYP